MVPETEIVINNLLKKCGARGQLLKGVGSTELIAAATSTYEGCNEIGSAGVPLSRMNCKIVDKETDEEVSYNHKGEICFTGPTLMLGYYNNKQATDEIVKVHSDGKRWLHTGDIGYMTEDGILYVTGRIKRISMTKGRDGQITKLFPDRVERAISSSDLVELCCVICVPDELRIHYPKAFVTLKENIDKDQAKEEILNLCKEKLPEYMVPEEIKFVDSLPRTSRGKINYRALE